MAAPINCQHEASVDDDDKDLVLQCAFKNCFPRIVGGVNTPWHLESNCVERVKILLETPINQCESDGPCAKKRKTNQGGDKSDGSDGPVTFPLAVYMLLRETLGEIPREQWKIESVWRVATDAFTFCFGGELILSDPSGQSKGRGNGRASRTPKADKISKKWSQVRKFLKTQLYNEHKVLLVKRAGRHAKAKAKSTAKSKATASPRPAPTTSIHDNNTGKGTNGTTGDIERDTRDPMEILAATEKLVEAWS